MPDKKTKFIIFSLFFLAFVFGPGFVLAQGLEISYPSIPGVENPNQFMPKIESGEYPPEMALPLYIKYLYYLFLTIAAFLAFGAIVYGGIQYLISFDSPAKLMVARGWMLDGVLGLTILLSSYLILTLINPQLAVFHISGLERADVDLPDIEEYGPKTPVYFQIPLGMIIERAVLSEEGRQKMENAKIAAEETRAAGEEVARKAEELKNETNKCLCGMSECYGEEDAEPCIGKDCPEAVCDIDQIETKSNELREAMEVLHEKQAKLGAAKAPLTRDLQQIRAAAYLMSLGDEEIFAYNDLLTIKHFEEDVEISAFPGWKNINLDLGGKIIKDPATFYLEKERHREIIFEASHIIGMGGLPGFPPPSDRSSIPVLPQPGYPIPPPPPPGTYPPIPPGDPGTIIWPINNPICSDDYCSYRTWDDMEDTYPCCGWPHSGIDFAHPLGTPIYAVAPGTVIRAGELGSGYGIGAIILHNTSVGDFYTYYTHMCDAQEGGYSCLLVSAGEAVDQGQAIGLVGSTGNSSGAHLHFEMRRQAGSRVNPLNYLPENDPFRQQCFDRTMNYTRYHPTACPDYYPDYKAPCRPPPCTKWSL